jgi:YhcH/YjgK/YiaL family protein
MILDELRNAPLYRSISPRMAQALDFLQKTDFARLEPGRRAVQGEEVFALVLALETKPKGAAIWEAHRRYIDVQYVFEGAERMGRADVRALKPSGEYDAEKDLLKLKGRGDFFTVPAGTFVIFWPHDAHLPDVALKAPQPVKKAVVKVLVGP